MSAIAEKVSKKKAALLQPREDEGRGTSPVYLSVAAARRVDHFKIGDRKLTPFEEGDALLVGLSRDELAKMTPKKLRSLADSPGTDTNLLLGC